MGGGGGTPKLHKEEENVQMRRVLLLTGSLDLSLPEILDLPLKSEII